MLEHYYVRPDMVDRVRSSWIAPAFEEYVAWLATHGYRDRTVSRRIPLLATYGEFAKRHGATVISQLPDHVEPFVQAWVTEHAGRRAQQPYAQEDG